MLLPWMLVSILGSLFVDKFAKEKFRYEFGQKLGLGSLCYEEKDGDEFLSSCKTGRAGLVEILLKYGKASVLNKTDADGLTGLHLACREGRVETVKMLVSQTCLNINVKDAFSVTPLQELLVFHADHQDVADIFYAQGIDPNRKYFFFFVKSTQMTCLKGRFV